MDKISQIIFCLSGIVFALICGMLVVPIIAYTGRKFLFPALGYFTDWIDPFMTRWYNYWDKKR